MLLKQILKDWGLEAVILFLFVFILLPFGPAITFDTVSFFQAGDNLITNGQYVHYAADGDLEFAAHRFPLYPILVGLFRSIDWSLLTLQIILFAAFVAFSRRFILDLKAPKYFLLLFATIPVILCFYSIWTESLYGVLFMLLLVHLRKEENYQTVIWIILIVLLLCLTRMVGIVVAGSLLIAYLIEKRALRGLLIGLVGVVTILAWTFLGTYHLGDTARSLSSHVVNYQQLKYIIIELGYWIAPTDTNWITLLIGGCVLLFPLVLLLRSWKNRQEHGVLHWFLLIHFYSYLLFIIVARSFIDASVAFNERTLFPVMINYVAILVMAQVGEATTEGQKRKMKFILPKIFIVTVVMNVPILLLIKDQGIGYNGKDWKEFAFISELENLQADFVYTNDQAAIYLYAPQIEKPVLLPEKMNLYTQLPNDTYQEEVDVMMDNLNMYEPSYIVWIRNGITEAVYPNYDEVKELPNMKVLYDDWLCVIMRKMYKGESTPLLFSE